MRQHKALRLSLAIMLGSGAALLPGCGSILRHSLREGGRAFLAGSAAGYFDSAGISNLLNNMLTGGFTSGWDWTSTWDNSPFHWGSI